MKMTPAEVFAEQERLVELLTTLCEGDPFEAEEWDKIWAIGEDEITIDEREWLWDVLKDKGYFDE